MIKLGAIVIAAATGLGAVTFWSGHVGTADLTWTSQDLRADDGGFSACSDAKAELPEGGDATFKVVWVAGGLIGLRFDYDIECGGYDIGGFWHFKTFDVATGKRIDALDLFPDRALRQALLADPWVQGQLARVRDAGVDEPKSAADIFAATTYRSTEGTIDSDNFELHHAEGDYVAVRFPITSPGVRFQETGGFVGLVVKAPAELRAQIAAGFLSRDAPKGATTCHFRCRTQH